MTSISLAICRVNRSEIPDAVLAQVKGQDDLVSVVTWIPGDQIFRIGLPKGAICGVLRDGAARLDPNNFLQNRDFIDLLHHLNSTQLDPALVEFVERSPEPSVAVIDRRSPDVNAAVPNDDIIGLYEIEHRKIVRYRTNPNYRLVTQRGSFMLTPWICGRLAAAVLPQS